MALPVTIPNEFANATASIPLSQLDTNFTTLADAVNGISDGSETLANASVTVLTAGTVDINGGNIDGTAIGGSTAAAGLFTTTNRTLTLPDDTGTIVTDSGNQAGSFTTLNTSGAVVFNDAGADVDFRVEGDTNANLLFVDAGNDRVGIGTSTPTANLDIVYSNATVYASTSAPTYGFQEINTSNTDGSMGGIRIGARNAAGQTASHFLGTVSTSTNYNGDFVIQQRTGSSTYAERMRIDSSGNLLVGKTVTTFTTDGVWIQPEGTAWLSRTSDVTSVLNRNGTDGSVAQFYKSGSQVGSISVTGSATAFNTSSDYRLKENVVPMAGALARVLQLNPVTYTWKAGGFEGQGFIAHELQAVCPDAVTGEKDATEIQQVEASPAVPATYDEEGNELTPAVEAVYEEREVPKYQGVDTSFLVATLTAAIQELSAKNDALEARIAALETGV